MDVRRENIVSAAPDGVSAIPTEIADDNVAKAFENVATEDRRRDDLRDDALLSGVRRRYKVL